LDKNDGMFVEELDFKDVKGSSISPNFKTTFSFKLAWQSM
jgi:hypothetical protein